MNPTKLLLILILLIAGVWFGWHWLSRAPTEADDTHHPVAENSDAPAAVVRVQRATIGNSLSIAGEFKPFQDVDVHAKVAGYIRTIYVEVGDRVKEGQTLAVLEIPELAAELAGTDAAVRRSQGMNWIRFG